MVKKMHIFVTILYHSNMVSFFIAGRSTVTNLTIYYDFLVYFVDSIYTDLTRAFDLVNLDVLFRKLHAYGVCGNLLNWFPSYIHYEKIVYSLYYLEYGLFIFDVIMHILYS